MELEIIAGVIVGIIASFVLGVWATRKNTVQAAVEPTALSATTESTVPIQKRLREANYECERQQLQCNNQIDLLCQQLLDLLQDVGRVSHVAVEGKPLFFAYHHPLTGERRYYYERDLSSQIAPNALEQTRQLAQQYQQHLNALLTQRTIFEQLIHSHQENLNRLTGVSQQTTQAQKIADHRAALSDLKEKDRTEEGAIYNQLLLQEIEEEVDYQEECLRQYIDLAQTYQNPLDQHLDTEYQYHLEELLQRLESEDPSQPN